MIIDFHTHVFPDALAPRGLAVLKESCGNAYTPHTDMTVNGLLSYMDEHGIDISVVQPVITKPSQTKGTNEWAASICSDRIISFGGIYPHTDDYKKDIDFVVSLGLKGIKLHAEYQDFILDSPEMLRIYDYAFSKGLIIIHHAGFDPAFPPPIKTSPERFAKISEELKGGIMVAAHLGGQQQWDDVEKYIVGTSIYIDTSMGFGNYSKEQFMRIVKAHGADKVLFASDSPWSDAASEIKTLKSLELTETEKNRILYENTQRILRL